MIDLNVPRSGGSNELHDIFNKEEEIKYMLNGNIQHEDGNILLAQNEQSNLLCSRFKPGYTVIHNQPDRVNNTIYFFLFNEETGCSEIGKITKQNEYTQSDIDKSCGCDSEKVLSEPLEEQDEFELCTYETVITDCCPDLQPKCLNFKKEHRISSTIKLEANHNYLYWVDGNNPDRVIDLNNLEKYKYKKECNEEEEFVCLDCEALKMRKEYHKPCLFPEKILTGGNLKEGAYLGMIAYCDEAGNEATQYMSQTNWVMVKNNNERLYVPTELDRNSGYGIRFRVANLDTNHKYYKAIILVVAEENNASGAASGFVVGVFPTTQNEYSVYSINRTNENRISIDQITKPYPLYYNSKFVAQANRTLFKAGLQGQEEINLQQVVNFIGQFAKWRTVIANEDLYEDGVFISLYEQYMGDEVYPLAISFFTNRGYFSTPFPLISRALSTWNNRPEDEILTDLDKNYLSIISQNPNCGLEERNKLWQFYNTATVEETEFDCIKSDIEVITEERAIKKTYFNPTLETIDDNTTWVDIELNEDTGLAQGEVFTNFTSYIANRQVNFPNENWFEGTDPTDDPFGLRTILNSIADNTSEVNEMYSSMDCDGTPELITSYLEVADESNLKITSKYEFDPEIQTLDSALPKISGNGQFCSTLQTESVDDKSFIKGDVEAIETMKAVVYWKSPFQGCDSTTEVDYDTNNDDEIEVLNKASRLIGTRQLLSGGLSCTSSQTITISQPSSEIRLDFIVPNLIEKQATFNDAVASYSTNKSAEQGNGFTDKLYKNAIWFKYKHNPTDQNINYSIVQIAKSKKAEIKDTLSYSEYIRVTVYEKCNDTNIYNDGLGNTYSYVFEAKNGYSFLLRSLTYGKEYFIAIDSPIVRQQASCKLIESYNSKNIHLTYDSYVLPGTLDCSQIKISLPEVVSQKIDATNVTFQRVAVYSKDCIVKKIGELKCDPQLYAQGRFAYWESTAKYPCNEFLWNSSKLKIKPSDIPQEYRSEFQSVFTNGTGPDGNYILREDRTNFADKNIRHFKLPDDRVSPHQDGGEMPDQSNTSGMEYGGKNKIFPKGIWISNNIINTALDLAVSNEIITQEFRDEIVGYEIHRGDRRKNRSIIAKGLAFDVLDYTEEEDTEVSWQVPNYPFNDLRRDTLHTIEVKPKVLGHKYTFHSPNTHYERPGTASMQEVKLEMLKWGETSGKFLDVKDYPKYIILSPAAFTTAEILAIAEVTLENALRIADMAGRDNEVFRFSFGFVKSANPVGLGLKIAAGVALAASLAISYAYEVGRKKYEWIERFYNNGTPQNFSNMYVGVSKYQNFSYTGNQDYLRGLASKFYLYQDRYQLTGSGFLDINLNNLDRESSLYLHLGYESQNGVIDTAKPFDFNYASMRSMDNSRYIASEVGACDSNPSRDIRDRYTMSPYLSIKNYVPDQYGQIDSVVWIPLMYCGKLLEENECDVVFGGDTYISRLSVKRKMRLYVGDYLGLSSLSASEHRAISNIRYTKFYLDHNAQLEDNFLISIHPTKKSIYRLDCETKSGNYFDGRSRFYLYYIGIVHFLVESDFNNNFRYGQDDREKNFYENVSDYLEWCQPSVTRFDSDNYYSYRSIFSFDEQFVSKKALNVRYDPVEFRLNADLSNKIIYSNPDFQNRGLDDPYLINRANDQYDFEKKEGQLFGIRAIEDNKVLALFENGFVVFNAYSQLPGTTETYTVGDGNIFKNRPTKMFDTDMGYAGTQHGAISSNRFGHFWVDAKRGTVHMLGSSAGNYEEISQTEYHWFKENLPFRILKDFPNLPLTAMDNTTMGLGIAIGFDARYKRIFFTKKDARIKSEYKDKVTHDGTHFILEENGVKTIIYPYETEYFDDYSWTRAYYPELKSWYGSFYSFKPDYYIEELHNFKTGYIDDGTLYNHLITNRSFQVFRGKLYPFKLEIALVEKYVNKMLSHIEYWLDVRRYHNEMDWAELNDRNLDYIVVYGNSVSSGKLKLVNREPNNMFQELQYPKYNNDNVEILATNNLNRWSINFLYNHVRRQNTNIPLWLKSLPQDDKELNNQAYDYTYTLRDWLKSDTFRLLFVQELESRLKYIFKFKTTQNKPIDN